MKEPSGEYKGGTSKESENKNEAIRILNVAIERIKKHVSRFGSPLPSLTSENFFEINTGESEEDQQQNQEYRIECFIAATRIEEFQQCIEAVKQNDTHTALCLLIELQDKVQEIKINNVPIPLLGDFANLIRLIAKENTHAYTTPVNELRSKAEALIKKEISERGTSKT